MPFFIPRQLIEYEYYPDNPPDLEYEKMIEPYAFDIGFSYFAVKLGYSLKDYEAITPRQRALILKQIELQEVQEDMRMNAAVANALQNVLRKKNQRARPLWKKKRNTIEDREKAEEMKIHMKEIEEVEKSVGKDWVRRIYKENGMEGII